MRAEERVAVSETMDRLVSDGGAKEVPFEAPFGITLVIWEKNIKRNEELPKGDTNLCCSPFLPSKQYRFFLPTKRAGVCCESSRGTSSNRRAR